VIEIKLIFQYEISFHSVHSKSFFYYGSSRWHLEPYHHAYKIYFVYKRQTGYAKFKGVTTPEYQFKPIIIGHACVNIEKMKL